MKTLRKINEHRRVFLLAILVLLLLIFLLIFSYQKSEVDNQLTDLSFTEKKEIESQDENQDESIEIRMVQGQLMEITETSIMLFNFEKLKEDSDLKEVEESMEVYNIKALTPVTKGIEEKFQSALHELEIGQSITVDYDQKTMDVINININDQQTKI